jgi:hypothetical protein
MAHECRSTLHSLRVLSGGLCRPLAAVACGNGGDRVTRWWLEDN